ncbi:MAG: hypothetical protein M0Z95_08300, partial [Actinomycetota bacterium]|nr:hypothetical protein [Actinomycetota bacterium]
MPATHEVLNQVPPIELNTADDAALREALQREGAGWAEAEVRELGALAGDPEVIELGRLANLYPPVLNTHDRYGHRIDEVEYIPAYHQLMVRPENWISPAGESPVRVNAGEPGSRPRFVVERRRAERGV